MRARAETGCAPGSHPARSRGACTAGILFFEARMRNGGHRRMSITSTRPHRRTPRMAGQKHAGRTELLDNGTMAGQNQRTPELRGPVRKDWSRDLVSIRDFTPEEVRAVIDLTSLMKSRPGDFRGALSGKQMVMFFEKPSLRTRLTFEAGMASLGGTSFFVDQTASRIDARESLSDVAHNLERWVDGIVLRTFAHTTVQE